MTASVVGPLLSRKRINGGPLRECLSVAYDNTNRGVLFKNNKKKSEKSPDFTGNGNWKGEEIRIAGWFKKSKAGNTYTSLVFSEAEEKQQEANNDNGDFQDAASDEWG